MIDENIKTSDVSDNTKRRAGRAGGPCSQMKNMNFPLAGELHKNAGWQVKMARAAISPVFGPSAMVLKQSASNFFSDDVTPGRYSLLAKNFCFLQSFII